VYLPESTSEQQQIVSILSSLDKKIELNQRMNKTIGEIGKAIFKHWFVDFEFSNNESEMIKSELGTIPKGWQIYSLYELADYVNGKAFKTKNFTEEGLSIIKISELKNGINSDTKLTSDIFDEKYLLAKRDVLFSWSGSPETSIDCFIWSDGSAWLNQHIFKVVSKPKYSDGFIYFLLKYFMPLFISIAKNKQTTGLGHVTLGDLKRIKIALPEEIENLDVFDSLFNNLYENLNIIKVLSSIRDSLLPRLMSGRLRVN